MTYGTEPHKLHRTDATGTSVDAAYDVDTSKLEGQVHAAIKAHGPNGCVQDDVIARFPSSTPYSSITARFSALLRKNLIHTTGERRKGRSGKGQRVLVDGAK